MACAKHYSGHWNFSEKGQRRAFQAESTAHKGMLVLETVWSVKGVWDRVGKGGRKGRQARSLGLMLR